MRVSRHRYNEALHTTRKEQLLLNLVRLQYREEPMFLDVGTVTAQFSFRASGDVGGILREGPPPNPHQLNVGIGVSVEERPTFTLTPLQGKDFAHRLLAPLDIDLIALLVRSGWSIDRVLRLTVQNMNGLDNAARASGPTPSDAPQCEAFARVTELFRELQKEGLLEWGHAVRPQGRPVTFPLQSVQLMDVVEARRKGFQVETIQDESGTSVVLSATTQALVWHISAGIAQSVAVQEIVTLLGLEPGGTDYRIQIGLVDQPASSASGHGRAAIHVTTRSLMGVLFYLSQAVEVPSRHRELGLVTTTLDAAGQPFDWAQVTGDLLDIRSRRTRPGDAAVAVRYRGHWFYVADSDLTSKSTLALLGQLFALQAGSAASAAPMLTLPVGG